MPDAMVVFYDCFFIEDVENQELYLITNGQLQEAKKSMTQMEKLLTNIQKQQNDSYFFSENQQAGPYPDLELTELERLVNKPVSKEEYEEAIKQVIEYIVKGHIYVMNLTQRLTISSTRPPYEVFQRLQQHNPAPFSAYLNYEEGEIISASPERFLRIQNWKIETRPIKGCGYSGRIARHLSGWFHNRCPKSACNGDY